MSSIDIVIIRDPDYSNEIFVFGDYAGQVAHFDLDLGRADLSNFAEFKEWAESLEIQAVHARQPDARQLIASIVREVARDHEFPIPDWAA